MLLAMLFVGAAVSARSLVARGEGLLAKPAAGAGMLSCESAVPALLFLVK